MVEAWAKPSGWLRPTQKQQRTLFAALLLLLQSRCADVRPLSQSSVVLVRGRKRLLRIMGRRVACGSVPPFAAAWEPS